MSAVTLYIAGRYRIRIIWKDAFVLWNPGRNVCRMDVRGRGMKQRYSVPSELCRNGIRQRRNIFNFIRNYFPGVVNDNCWTEHEHIISCMDAISCWRRENSPTEPPVIVMDNIHASLLRLVLSTPTCSSVHYNNFKLLNVLSRHFHREIFQSLPYSVIDLLITF